MHSSIALMIALVAPAAVPGGGPVVVVLDLSGSVDGRGLPMAESAKPVHRFQLIARVDKNGEGNGTLTLDPTPSPVDEFGFPMATDALPPLKLNCSLRFVKQKKILRGDGRIGAPAVEVESLLISITGPKITSRLSLATETEALWSYARLIVSDMEGPGKVGVTLRSPPPAVPCHPGCFPSGTPIDVPGGTEAIENLRAGSVVTTVGPDGTRGQGRVASMSLTRNRIIEVRTERDTLATTETQPLSLADGGLREAGKLKAGDRIHSWDGHERRAVEVRSVAVTGRETDVFNLVLREPVLFIADGFLARSKPPAPANDPIRP